MKSMDVPNSVKLMATAPFVAIAARVLTDAVSGTARRRKGGGGGGGGGEEEEERETLT